MPYAYICMHVFMYACKQIISKKRQNAPKLRRPHENDAKNNKTIPRMRRPHENDAKNNKKHYQNVTSLRKFSFSLSISFSLSHSALLLFWYLFLFSLLLSLLLSPSCRRREYFALAPPQKLYCQSHCTTKAVSTSKMIFHGTLYQSSTPQQNCF